MKKRILSIVLVLCILLAVMPTTATTVLAADEITLTQSSVTSGGTLNLVNGKSYKMGSDITIRTTIIVTGTVTLDLGGYVLSMNGTGGVITVNGGNLTIKSNGIGSGQKLFQAQSDGLYKYVTAFSSGAIGTETSDGVITGGAAAANGGGVYVTNGGTCTLERCNIIGCAATNGGGVYVTNGGTFVNSGRIVGCKATNGGGVYVGDNGTFTMNDWAIAECTGTTGGALYVSNSTNATVNLNGGTVRYHINSIGGVADINAGRGDCNTTLVECGYQKVKFDLNGGQYDGSTAAVNRLVVNGGKVANVPVPTREGGTFNGWYTAASGGTKVDPATVAISDDTTFYAQYTLISYTVTFDANGGTGTMGKQTFNYDVAQELTENAFTRTGYTFDGWATSAEGSKVYDDKQSVQNLTTQSNITLYARWTPLPAEKPSVDISSKNKQVTYGKSGSISVTATAASGHEITGYQWYTCDKTGSNAKIIKGATSYKCTIEAGKKVGYYYYCCVVTSTRQDNGQTATKTSITINVRIKKADQAAPDAALFTATAPTAPGGNDGKIAGTTTAMQYRLSTEDSWTTVTGTEITGLVAGTYEIRYKSSSTHYASEATQVTVNETYSITYELGGGTLPAGQTNPALYTVESSDILLNNPTRVGYDFIGWTGTDLAGDGQVAVTIPTGSTGNRSYTAQYAPKSGYTISLDVNGGKALADKTGVKWTDKILNIVPTPTRTGYTFQGWKHNGADVTADTAYQDLVAGDTHMSITLVAQWEENSGYKVIFDSAGGTAVGTKTNVKWTDTVLDSASVSTRDGYEFTGWKWGNTAVTSGTTYGQLAGENDTLPYITLTAQWKDITAPTGEIQLGTNSWRSLLNHITFGLFFKDTQEITITATDNSGEEVTIEYLLSDRVLTDLETAPFAAYTGQFTVEPNNEYVIYAKLTDKAGNVAYINSDGIVLDNVKPVISGIEDGKTYCAAQTVTVSDKYGVTVTVNGNPVTPDTNGQFTLSPAESEQKIVVTDKAGNQTEMTVTVNDGHTYYWQSESGKYWQKCNFCEHETAKKDIPEITINGADKVCRMQDYTFTFTLPEGVTDPKAAYYPAESNRPLVVTENDGVYTATVSHTEYEDDYNISKFFVKVYAKTADGFEFLVRKEVLFSQEHTGGTADCTHKAKCEVCGEEYGEVDSTKHDLENIKGNAATVTETGNREYWHCKDCDDNFSDRDGKNEIDLKDTVLGKLPPAIIDGKGQSLTVGEARALTFRSNAAYSDFIRVELDGETVDGRNYTTKEGSTIVTLKADYVATLSAGEHTLGIVSESGTATTTFIVHAKAVDTDSPQTGADSHVALWLALLFVSGGALVGIAVYGRKAFCKGKMK